MDQTNLDSSNAQVSGALHQVTSPVTNKHSLPPIFFLLVGILLGATGLWAFQNYSPLQSKQIVALPTTSPTTSPTASPEVTPTPTLDPTADWSLFTSPAQKISFKYSPSWKLASTPGDNVNGNIINEAVKLTNDQATISMYFNMDGIGGLGRDYEGTAIDVGGQSLYEYKTVQTDSNKVTVGLTDDLTESLGVFRHNGKTYYIALTYPDSYEKTDQGAKLQAEFNQLLSTFKFSL